MADTTTIAQPAATNYGGAGPGSASAAAAQQASDMAKYFPDTGTSSSSSTASPLIVTSNASRSTYANNVNTLNGAISNLNQNGPDPSIVDFLNTNKMPSDYNSRASMAKQYGIQGYTGSAAQNTQLLGILRNGGNTKTDTTKTDTGGGTGTDGGGTGTGTGKSDSTSSAGALDPAIKGMFDKSISDLDSQIADAKSTLSSALATLQNDPAAASAISMIEAKFDQQIEAMKNKNAVILGGQVTNAARSGSMQYANEMFSDFFSQEQSAASNRLADLITKESSAIMNAQALYKKGDVAAFDAASKQLDAITKQKTETIQKLLDATDKAAKAAQASAKIAATAAKQQTTDNIRISTANASGIAKSLSDSGITDPEKKKAYIAQMAQKLGISDPSYLESAVAKVSLSNANTQSTIDKRNKPASVKPPASAKPGKDGAYTYTSDDISAYSNLMNQGGKDPSGTVYNGRGSDGFVDPGTYTASYTDWIKNGGTPAGFLKKFPVTNVNPESYSTLPKALQPKPAKTTTSSVIPQ